MSILSKLMSTMRLTEADDDDYYLDGDDSYEDEDDMPRRSIFSRRQEEEEYDEEPETKSRFLGRSSAKVVPIRRGLEVTLIKPNTMEVYRGVGDHRTGGAGGGRPGRGDRMAHAHEAGVTAPGGTASVARLGHLSSGGRLAGGQRPPLR